ncbi:hypothetical protein Btru_036543 [Bulinus truncatus]|nr:hypothetical protein Btru_036543 [Bulinus truncatus]
MFRVTLHLVTPVDALVSSHQPGDSTASSARLADCCTLSRVPGEWGVCVSQHQGVASYDKVSPFRCPRLDYWEKHFVGNGRIISKVSGPIGVVSGPIGVVSGPIGVRQRDTLWSLSVILNNAPQPPLLLESVNYKNEIRKHNFLCNSPFLTSRTHLQLMTARVREMVTRAV